MEPLEQLVADIIAAHFAPPPELGGPRIPGDMEIVSEAMQKGDKRIWPWRDHWAWLWAAGRAVKPLAILEVHGDGLAAVAAAKGAAFEKYTTAVKLLLPSGTPEAAAAERLGAMRRALPNHEVDVAIEDTAARPRAGEADLVIWTGVRPDADTVAAAVRRAAGHCRVGGTLVVPNCFDQTVGRGLNTLPRRTASTAGAGGLMVMLA